MQLQRRHSWQRSVADVTSETQSHRVTGWWKNTQKQKYTQTYLLTSVLQTTSPWSTRCCLGWRLTTDASSLMLAQGHCATFRLGRFLSVGRGPTLVKESSVQLDGPRVSTICRQTSDSQTCYTVAADIFMWSVGLQAQRELPFKFALEILLLTY